MHTIIGLGNPGTTYSGTSHNVGFYMAEAIIKKWRFRPRPNAYRSLIHAGRIQQTTCMVIQPQTYMNESGLALKAIKTVSSFSINHSLLIYDDFDLPLGTIRLREKGSAGTHNGMKSVIEHVGHATIPRLRIGIGPLPNATSVTDFVLAPFTDDEQRLITDTVTPHVLETIHTIITRKS